MSAPCGLQWLLLHCCPGDPQLMNSVTPCVCSPSTAFSPRVVNSLGCMCNVSQHDRYNSVSETFLSSNNE